MPEDKEHIKQRIKFLLLDYSIARKEFFENKSLNETDGLRDYNTIVDSYVMKILKIIKE